MCDLRDRFGFCNSFVKNVFFVIIFVFVFLFVFVDISIEGFESEDIIVCVFFGFNEWWGNGEVNKK
eukprot:UN00615